MSFVQLVCTYGIPAVVVFMFAAIILKLNTLMEDNQ